MKNSDFFALWGKIRIIMYGAYVYWDREKF